MCCIKLLILGLIMHFETFNTGKNNLLFEQNLYFSDTLKKHTTYTSRVICIKIFVNNKNSGLE